VLGSFVVDLHHFEIWSREWELNPRPADFSADIMLLYSRALFLTTPYGFAWYLASFVQKLFTPNFCAELRSSDVLSPNEVSPQTDEAC